MIMTYLRLRKLMKLVNVKKVSLLYNCVSAKAYAAFQEHACTSGESHSSRRATFKPRY